MPTPNRSSRLSVCARGVNSEVLFGRFVLAKTVHLLFHENAVFLRFLQGSGVCQKV